jgi:hypothetical protein
LAFGFYALLIATGAHALEDQTLLDRSFGLWVGVIVGLSLGGLIIWLERPVKVVWAFVAVTLLIFAAWGMIQIINCFLDQGAGYPIQTYIGGLDFTKPVCTGGSGRYSTRACRGRFSQYMLLSPAPYGLPARLSIDMGWYRHAQIRDRVCIVEHAGRFGARWYKFAPCPAD